MVKAQCRNCGGIMEFESLKNPKVINDFGHFKFIESCEFDKNQEVV